MKNYKKKDMTKLAMSLLSIAVLTACSSETDVTEQQQSSKPFTLSASIGTNEPQTRASVDYGNTNESVETFKWNTGDSFEMLITDAATNVIHKNGESIWHTFTINDTYSNDKKSNKADFTSLTFPSDKSNVNYFALYPAGKFTKGTTEDSDINWYYVPLPQIQTQNGANTDHLKNTMLMEAHGAATSSDIISPSFSQLTSLFRFTVKNANSSSCKVKTIKVTCDGKAFYTSCAILVDDDQLPDMNNKGVGTKLLGEQTSITLNMSSYELAANATVDGYMNVMNELPIQDLHFTFELTVENAKGEERTYPSFALSGKTITDVNPDGVVDGKYYFEKGKRYWFDLTLNDELTAGLVSVTPWGDGGTLTGGEAQE